MVVVVDVVCRVVEGVVGVLVVCCGCGLVSEIVLV